MSEFTLLKPEEIDQNVFKLIGGDWMLVAAGTPENFNMMTASWGGMGVLWNKNVCWCVIRPQRYTYQFVEANDVFSLSFFGREHRSALKHLGTVSGRDSDKMASSGLTPIVEPEGGVYFEEARLVLDCRKIYYQDLEPEHFLDPSIINEYPKKDFHRMYVGEVVRCLKR